MIQLATDPTASRMSYRPQGEEAKAQASGTPRGRSGHAWPFLSRQPIRPSRQQDDEKPTSSDSGS